MSGSCAYCGRPATERDHLTGRAGPGDAPYFDAELWVPSCRACNCLNAKCWRTLGIDKEFSTTGRMLRLAFGSARLKDGPGWQPAPSFWDGHRRLVVAVADELEDYS